jgi:hypothetical protein
MQQRVQHKIDMMGQSTRLTAAYHMCIVKRMTSSEHLASLPVLADKREVPTLHTSSYSEHHHQEMNTQRAAKCTSTLQ